MKACHPGEERGAERNYKPVGAMFVEVRRLAMCLQALACHGAPLVLFEWKAALGIGGAVLVPFLFPRLPLTITFRLFYSQGLARVSVPLSPPPFSLGKIISEERKCWEVQLKERE